MSITPAKVAHSQQDKVPTLHTPADPLVKQQSKDVFERLTVSRASTRHQTPLGLSRTKEKHAAAGEFEDSMMKKVVRSQARLRMVREKMEADRLQEMREYPKISEKSKELAEKADEKFFSRFNIRPHSGGRVRVQRPPLPDTPLPTSPKQVHIPLKPQMDFLEPEEATPAPAMINSGLKERIRQYLLSAQPAAPTQDLNSTLQDAHSRGRSYSHQYNAQLDNRETINLRVPEKTAFRPAAHKARGVLGATLSPVMRQVSYDSGCDWDALLARKKS